MTPEIHPRNVQWGSGDTHDGRSGDRRYKTDRRDELYVCAWAAEFPAQALLRLRPEMAHEPVVILDGLPPQQTVCAMNRAAQRRGAAYGMTRLEAEALGACRLLARSADTEAAARKVLLECAAQFSPRIEEASAGTACAFVLDIAGTERLFGPPQQLAERLRAALAAAGFRASIAVCANYHAARMKAAASRGIAVIPEGAEAAALEKLPIAALALAPEHEEVFALWGIGTLGELAALPETELVTRLGPQAQRWRALARGAAEHAFQPIEPEFVLEEFCEFEDSVAQLDSLLFIGARMIDCLAARAASRALLLARLNVRLKLEDGTLHERAIRPALPTADRKFLLKLLQLEIGTHPPQAAVAALTLTAEAGPSSQVQLGLFAPQTPEPSRLDVTIARLKALVGGERVGAAALEDTNRADSFRMEDFSLAANPGQNAPCSPQNAPCPILSAASSPKGWEAEDVPKDKDRAFPPLRQKEAARTGHGTIAPGKVPRMTLRRLRPPAPVHVVLRAHQPAAFRDRENRFEVSAAYGPWLSSGCWWAGEWDTEEWDVLATKADGTAVACLLACDRTRNTWRIEAYYD